MQRPSAATGAWAGRGWALILSAGCTVRVLPARYFASRAPRRVCLAVSLATALTRRCACAADGGGNETKVNENSKPLPYPFVSLYLGGRTDGFVLKGGNAQGGTLDTQYDGPRPDCAIAGTCNRHPIQNASGTFNRTYQPADKKGAIILATGGDMSNSAMGKFYEGMMVTGAHTLD